MLQRWLKTIATWIKAKLPGIGFNLLLFLVIVWAAIALARLTRRLVESSLKRRPSNISQLLQRMIISGAGNVVLILGLLFGLAQLGFSVGPLLTGLGIAGFIVGFALQDSLGNFASGVLILLYRPYDIGDFIETNGVLGKVSRMSLVNTTVLTIDNQTLVLPNSKIWGEVIRNVTAQSERRVDMIFSIGYADDIAKAEKVLSDIVHSHEKVLEEPAPVVRLHTLNESSVDFVVRPWVRTEDYWDVYWDITRAVKIRFGENGISIPFPQRDIHLHVAEKHPGASRGELNTEQATVPLAGTQSVDNPSAKQT
jgi:small conductance mechanosensitive channel